MPRERDSRDILRQTGRTTMMLEEAVRWESEPRDTMDAIDLLRARGARRG